MTQLPGSPLDQDSVRAVLDEVFRGEQYQWDVRPSLWTWIIDVWRDVMAWFTRLETTHPGVYYALVAGLVVLLVAILTHLVYLTVLAFRRRDEDGQEPAARARRVRDAAWYLREAKRLEEAGLYSDSLACRFAALVCSLDRKKVIRAHPSKTPAEYVNEARLGPGGKEVFVRTVRWLYDHLFGGRRLDPRALAEFDRRTREVMAHGPG